MRAGWLIGAMALLLASCDSAPDVSDPKAAPTAQTAQTVNWPGHGGQPDESGYAALDQINTGNIGELGLASYLDLEGEQSLQATPLAIDGTLYFTGSYSTVYAVDAVTGKLLWKYDPEVWKHGPERMRYLFAVNRGAAYADGRVFVATLDGRLFALDAKTGKLLWSVMTLPKGSLHYISGAPLAFNGKVMIGNGGGDVGMRGYVTAYDGATGRQLWRFYTVPGSPEENRGDPAMEMAAATWSGEYWKTGTGGTVWNGLTFDPEANRIYIGTGNSGPYDPAVRSPGNGDNLFLVSIVALDADTGKYVWHYQMNPREAWDYKATMNMISATLPVDGKPRKVLMQAPTNGFFYVLDRQTGKPISAEKIGKVTWASHIDLKTGRPVEARNIRYETGESTLWPGPIGAHNWQAMSFSPKSGLVYIPYMQMGTRYAREKPKPGAFGFGGVSMTNVAVSPEDGKGALLAWDPVRQKPRWKVQHETIFNGGTLVTAGNLVFQGTPDGYFTAYDAENGRRLWRFYAGLGIISAPISYAVGGKQYVSVLVGDGGAASVGGMNMGWKYGAQTRRLLTFSLSGKAVLPPSPPRDMTVRALDDPSFRIDKAEVEAGAGLFAMNCALCHGRELQSAGSPGPDLRESAVSLQREAFAVVLREGPLLRRGMPKFDDLDAQQVRQLHAYIRAGAREALGKSKPVPKPSPGRL